MPCFTLLAGNFCVWLHSFLCFCDFLCCFCLPFTIRFYNKLDSKNIFHFCGFWIILHIFFILMWSSIILEDFYSNENISFIQLFPNLLRTMEFMGNSLIHKIKKWSGILVVCGEFLWGYRNHHKSILHFKHGFLKCSLNQESRFRSTQIFKHIYHLLYWNAISLICLVFFSNSIYRK